MNKTFISRRAICLLLCAIMVVPMLLTACGGAIANEGDEGAKTAQTLTISLIKEEGMTEEAITLVENAINEITEGQYNTHIELQMFTADEYQNKIISMSQELHMNEAGPGSAYISSEVILEEGKEYKKQANGDTVEIDEANRTHTIYPTLTNTQLDIVLIDSAETYSKLVAGAEMTPYLASLSASMGSLGTDMKKHINTTTLNHMSKLNEELYAIPNNSYYGEYSYMFVNKKYVDAFNYDVDLMTDFAATKNFLNDIVTTADYENVTPVYNFPGFDWLTYLGFESPLSARPAYTFDVATPFVITDIMATTYYSTCMQMLYDFSKSGKTYVDSETIDFTKDFAVAFMKGDHNVPEEYADSNNDGVDDYYVVTLSRPYVGNELFDSMYAVSAFTKNVDRSFEILSLLQTNETIVNLLAYGIEDVHYEIVNDMVVYAEDTGYKVNYKYAGNNFLLLPNDKMDETTLKYAENDWAFAKEHNNNLVISPYCGFVMDYASYTEYEENMLLDDGYILVELDDKSGVKVVNEKTGKDYEKAGKTTIYWYTDVILRRYQDMSAEYMERMEDFEAASEYDSYAEYLKALAAEFEATDEYSQVTGNASKTNDTYSNAYSPSSQYRAFWMKVYSA